MNIATTIETSLERLNQFPIGFGRSGLAISFKIIQIETEDEFTHYPLPDFEVSAVRDDVGDIIDYKLSFSLFYDYKDESTFHDQYKKLKDSKFGSYLRISSLAPSISPHISALLGNDLKTAAKILEYFVVWFAGNENVDIEATYKFHRIIPSKESCRVVSSGIKPSIALKNAVSTVFNDDWFYDDTLFMDILLWGHGEDNFLCDVVINKKEEGAGFEAWIKTRRFSTTKVNSSLKRYLEFPNKDCCSQIGIAQNKWWAVFKFGKNRIEDYFIDFLTDFLTMVDKSASPEDWVVKVKYRNFPPTIDLSLCFYTKGECPSENELKAAKQLTDNYEYDINAFSMYARNVEPNEDKGVDIDEFLKEKMNRQDETAIDQ